MNREPPLPPELWARTPPEVQVYIHALEARVVALEATVQRLEAVVQHVAATIQPWQEQVRQDSRPSSRPPSSDPPQAVSQRPHREPSGRRPGGQPGHEGQSRSLMGTEAVAVMLPVKPEGCRRCQDPLCGEDPQPQRHQVTEIPPMQPVVTEYRLHRLVCQVCGEATRAELPAGVAPGGFGPRVQASPALCTGAYHLSKRTTQRVLEDLFGVSMGLGTVATLEQATVQALTKPVVEARASGQAQPTVYMDETGWREGPRRAWLWAAVTASGTVFVVRLSRGAQVAQELLGEPLWGWLVTERWSAYSWSPPWRRQLCWAHLRRDIEAMLERGGCSREIGEALRVQARRMFHDWHRVRDGTLSPASFGVYMRPIRREVERWLEAGQTCGVPQTAGTCRDILKRRQALWTFVRHEGVEPTTNTAERAIRPGVLWRKGSFGTHRPEGSRFVEVMMTVVATLKPQHRHGLDYLTAACEAALCGQAAPSLLPLLDHRKEYRRPAA